MKKFSAKKVVGATAALSAVAALSFNLTSASAADPSSDLDAFGQVLLQARQHGSTTGQAVVDYCKEAGYGDPDKMPNNMTGERPPCELIHFSEVERDNVTKNYSRRVSDFVWGCPGVEGRQDITYTADSDVSFSHGASLVTSASFGVDGKAAPFGVGAEIGVSVGASVGYSFDYTKTESKSDAKTMSVEVRPGYVSWIDYHVDHGVVKGLAMVRMPFDPMAKIEGIEPGVYTVPESVSGDIWKPVFKKTKVEQIQHGYSADSRKMTKDELTDCGRSGDNEDIDPGGTGTS
ncbi:hypothetical protein [Streptomyces sp. 1222.5]|uniref:hypothetical protein n=1 Tax=Streptomyces sp. 1222.5 TaxID=1881026 RepID=UPI003EC12A62